MAKILLISLCLVLYHAPTLAYKAAVVEHYPTTSDTPENTILKNLNEYRSHVAAARNQSADIVVFPEYGLTTLVNNPEDYAIEILIDNHVINGLLTIAKENQIYLVVNLLEKVQESNKATIYYNTNLVFDRQGNITLKYRKINLFNESKLTPGDPNQDVTFYADFGVTFGIFTCFDILFANPSRRVLENVEVTDVVFPSAWYNTLPFFSSLSVQHGYSNAHGVNLLAADYGKPAAGFGGSGIFLSTGKAAELYISDSPSSKRIVQDITKITNRESRETCPSINPFGLPGDLDKNNVTNFKAKQDFRASEVKALRVDLNESKWENEICYGDFCCRVALDINTTSVDSSDHYKIVVFDDFTTIDSVKHHLRICSLISCDSDDITSCGNRRDQISTRFIRIAVSGNFQQENGTFYVPSTLDTYLLPIQQSRFCNTNNGTNTTFVQVTTTSSQQNVVVFGIVGKTSAASSMQTLGVFFLAVLALVKVAVF